jgi:tungstate transport system ATP-binding protein
MILPLTLEGVSWSVGERTILERLDLRIEAGECTVILGANGAGKSVLLRLMHGLLSPSAGTVSWAARDARRHQAMVFQRPVMLRRSALANVRYALQAVGVPDPQAQARQALEAAGLSHLADRSARRLSGGEQQRLALARAWAVRPEVIFLDEPTASLDPGAAREVEQLIRSIARAGVKVVMTTHSLGLARRLGGEVLFLHQGRLIERAPVDRFFSAPATTESAAFIRAELPW